MIKMRSKKAGSRKKPGGKFSAFRLCTQGFEKTGFFPGFPA